MRGYSKSVLVLTFLVVLLPGPVLACSFQGLTIKEGRWGVSMSGDGKTVVGNSVEQTSTWAWNNGTVTYYPVSYFPSTRQSFISRDGAVIWGTDSVYLYKMVNGTIETISGPGGMLDISGVSVDGSIVAGDSDNGSWIYQNGVYNTLNTPAGYESSNAIAMSDDGSRVAGIARAGVGGTSQPLYWDNGTPNILETLDGFTDGRTWGISGDGSTILGESYKRVDNHEIYQACLWRNGQIFSLGSYADLNTMAVRASADGSIVFGISDPYIFGNGEREAWIWDETSGMRPLRGYLQTSGIDCTGWSLLSVYDVSADGKTIAGWGINPQGQSELWIATIPEPATVLLIGLGGLFLRRKRFEI